MKGSETVTGATVSELVDLAGHFDTRALVAVLRDDKALAAAWAKAAEEVRLLAEPDHG
jgi:hypothetical protein